MEPWQKEYIKKHFDKLIENTEYTPKFAAILYAKDMLGSSDLDLLETKRNSDGRYAQLCLLYNITMTRSNAYQQLAFALRETKQTGASEILNTGYNSKGLENPALLNKTSHSEDVNKTTKWSDLSQELQGNVQSRLIHFMGKQQPLRNILDQLLPETVEELFTGTVITDLLKYQCKIDIKSNLPPKLTYYVSRNLEPRKLINVDLFSKNCDDVFVFKGIELNKLTEIANGQTTDISSNSNQTELLNVRFIQLEYDEDFKKIRESKICISRKLSVHLFQYKDGHVFWLQSHGSISCIQDFVEESPQDSLSEDEFVSQCLNSPSSQPVCISDTPGMGKTVLLSNLGSEILSRRPNSVVMYVVLREFGRKLSKNVENFTIEYICRLLSQQASDTKLGRNIVKELLLSKTTDCVVLLDGYDEVLSRDQPKIRRALEALKRLEGTRIYMTTRPHLRKKVENLLCVLGNNIQPFQEENQVEFLKEFWKEKGACPGDRLTEFASECLQNHKKHVTDYDRNFDGIPLLCRLLAEVHSDNALKISKGEQQGSGINISVFSIFELYKTLMDTKFCKREHMLLPHFYFAIKLLFPKWIRKLGLKPCKNSSEDICNVDILIPEMKHLTDQTVLTFIHRNLAEFLVAKFAIEYCDDTNDKFWKFFLTKLLATVDHTELPLGSNGFGEWEPINSARYKHPHIAYFINAHLRLKLQLSKTSSAANQTQIRFINPLFFLCDNITAPSNPFFQIHQEGLKYCNPDTFRQILTAAVCQDFEHLTYILVGFSKDFLPISLESLTNALLLCAKHGNARTFHQLRLIEQSRTIHDLAFQHSHSLDFMITPLHVAIQVGKYHLVEYLINRVYRDGLRSGQFPYLVHMCVYRSTLDEKVLAKKPIIRLISGSNKMYIHERLPDGTTPLCQDQVQPELQDLLDEIAGDNIGEG